MLIDLHAHSSGISRCCKVTARQVLEEAKKIGLDGIVLTNHYQKSYIPDGNLPDFVRRYMDEIRCAQALGDELGMRVFWGIEVTSQVYDKVHLEIYGVEEDFLEKYPELYDMTQEELWKTVRNHGGVLIHAHPYRRSGAPLDPRWMDGVEVNCHPKYQSTYREELFAFARTHGLTVTCGGDYHADTYRPVCGTFLPDSITDSRALGRFLAEAEQIELLVHEINAAAPERVTFHKQPNAAIGATEV